MQRAFSFGTPRLTRFVKRLILVLFVAFVVELICENWLRIPVFEWLALDAGHVGLHTAWQIVSYVLVEPPTPEAVASLLISLVFLWLIVAPFEERYGAKRTFQLSLVATLASAVSAVAVGVLSSSGGYLVGSQSISLATIAAFAMAMRSQQISLFGVVPMKPVHLVWLTVGYSGLMFLASRNLVVFASSIGAVVAGVVFAKWMTRPRTPKARPGGRPKAGRGGTPFRVIRGQGGDDDDPKRLLN